MKDVALGRIRALEGVLIENDHLVLKSGVHSRKYLNKDGILTHPETASVVCKAMAIECKGLKDIEVVVGPAIGGAILAQGVGYHLTTLSSHPLCAFAEKEGDGQFTFHRGYELVVKGQNVLVVEDVLTTGGSVKAVVEAVHRAGGRVVGVVAIFNRGSVTAEMLGVPHLISLTDVSIETWSEDACPMCQAKIPVNTTIGYGRKFLERRQAISHGIANMN